MNIRIQYEPSWILHSRPFKETSKIIDFITQDHGRISLVAKGVRSRKSRLGGILRPFMPLNISWSMRSDLGTLIGAENNGKAFTLNGDAFFSGCYINELILNLVHRHDPSPEVFSIYSEIIRDLSLTNSLNSSLRYFEMELLKLLGYALSLDHDSKTLDPISMDKYYEYHIDEGTVETIKTGPMVFMGKHLIAISKYEFDCPEVLQCANRLLRYVMAYYLDGKAIKSRKVLKDIKEIEKNN